MAPHPILSHALAYAANGWPIFRLGPSKKPLKDSHGHRDATTNLDQVRAWWDVPRSPNIGLACGAGAAPITLDLDGPTALESPWGASLAALAAKHGGLPETLMQRTRRGVHLLYLPPAGIEIRTKNEPRKTKGQDGVDLKGLGGYIVLSPSSSRGFIYEWIAHRPPASMPDWLVEWCLSVGHTDNPRQHHIAKQLLASRPDYLKTIANQRDITASAAKLIGSEWSPHEEARLRGALAVIPPTCGHDAFLRIGLALRGLDWERSDGTSIAFEIWDTWCARSEYYNPAGLEKKWEELGRTSRGEVSLGTVFAYAKEAGWKGEVVESWAVAPLDHPAGVTPVPAPTVGFGSPAAPQSLSSAAVPPLQALPPPLASPPGGFGFGVPIRRAAVFRDTTEDGNPKATVLNTRIAIEALGVACCKDLFHEKCYVAGEAVDLWAGDLSDDVVLMLRQVIRDRYGFDPGEKHARDAAVQLCLANQYDPLLDYLDGLRWDGAPRIERWLETYLGADDTPLNRAQGRLVLIAAVRRARAPGTKFDQILVLEGSEGRGKSSAVEIMAGGPAFYSDAKILGEGGREQQEATTGVWLYEIGDLHGMKRAEVESVKVFASRTVDRARPAYGRFRVDQPRRCVFVATTNDDAYLKSETGNRRFWPVKTGHVDLAGLRRDRDQLWAEAAEMEARGASAILEEALWDAARTEQDERMEDDPWTDLIRRYVDDERVKRDDVTVHEVLADNQHIAALPATLTTGILMRGGHCLRRLGWFKYRVRLPKGGYQWRYKRLQ